MLIDFTGNDAKTVALGDSERLSVYYPKNKNCRRCTMSAPGKQVVEQFLLLGFGASSAYGLKEVYEVTWAGTRDDRGTADSHLKLIPKSRKIYREQVTSAELWIGDNNGLPIQQKIIFTSGDYWLVTYSDIKFNPALSDDALKLKNPKGVQVQHPRF